MTPRAAIVYLLVVVLLACPLCCLARAADDAGGSAPEDCCGQGPCSSPASEPGRERSDGPPARPQNGTCLCHGAVLEQPATPPGLDGGLVSVPLVEPLLCGGESFFVERGVLAARTACHFPSADSGRKVRALIASLLL